MSVRMRIPKKVRITVAHEGHNVGDEIEVYGIVKAAGYVFYPATREVSASEDLIFGHNCEVIEYHEPA